MTNYKLLAIATLLSSWLTAMPSGSRSILSNRKEKTSKATQQESFKKLIHAWFELRKDLEKDEELGVDLIDDYDTSEETIIDYLNDPKNLFVAQKLTELEPSVSELVSLETSTHTATNLEELPDELLSHIFIFDVDISKLSKVCQKFNKICQPILQDRWDRLKDHPEARHIPMIMRLIDTPESHLERLYRFFCQRNNQSMPYERFAELNRSLSDLAGLNRPKNGDFTDPKFLLDLEHKIDDFNLEQIWPELRSTIIDRSPLASMNILHANAQAQEIKDWFSSPDNFAVQRVANLDLTNCDNLIHINLPCLSLALDSCKPKCFLKTKAPHNTGYLPKELSLFRQIMELRMPHGILREIDLNSFTNLRRLDLHDNNIEKVDLSETTKLTYLNLAHNKLENINVSMLTNLRYLKLDNNGIKEIKLSGISNIEALYLQKNKLEEIDLSLLTKLEILKLRYNRLEKVKMPNISGIFISLGNNKISYLARCKIMWVHGNNSSRAMILLPASQSISPIMCTNSLLNALLRPDHSAVHFFYVKLHIFLILTNILIDRMTL